MNKERKLIIWLTIFLGYLLVSATASGAVMESDFKSPPSRTRILKIVHSLPDSDEARNALFTRLQKQGFGGIVCNVSFDNYLQSEQKWDSFVNGVKKAREIGFTLWLYDERGYPSGNAGGLVLKNHPEWEARGLLVLTTNVSGSGLIKFEIPAGKPIYAQAFLKNNLAGNQFKKSVDLIKYIKGNFVEWDAPAGECQINIVVESRLYEGTHAELNLWQKIPYINLLQPEPTKEFLNLTHKKYAERLGNDLGKFFEATFTDEPSLMSLFLRPMPYKALPWGDNLPSEFKRRRGYDIINAVPSLFADLDENYKKYRYDFWLTIGELVSENYFGQIREWCRSHNIESGGHLLAEENIVHHVPLYGDFFRCMRMLDAPSIDCLTSIPQEVPWYIAKLAESAARIEGRRLVMCETSDHIQVYRPSGDKRPKRIVTEQEIRGTLNRLFVNGVNRITSYYSFTQLTDEELNRINLWSGRCGLLIESSVVDSQIAVLYPVESLWIRFVPSHIWTREATQAAKIESIYKSTIESLFSSQRDFLIISSDVIEKGRIKNGVLTYNDLKFRAVILPGADTLSINAWNKLSEFVSAGGALYLVGNFPENSEKQFPSKEVRRLTALWFKNFDGSNKNDFGKLPISTRFGKGIINYLPSGFESLVADLINADFPSQIKTSGNHNNLRVSKRRIQEDSLFFVINDSPNAWKGNLEFLKCEAGEIWNPFDGSINLNKSNLFSDIEIEPYSGRFFRFKKDGYDLLIKERDSKTFSVKFFNIKHNSPNAGKGEFVKSDIREIFDKSGKKIWQCEATLTKSDVDTWLFLSYGGVDSSMLNPTDIISFSIRIPEGQKTKNQILVIVKEKNGGDFIAETGAFLDESGEKRIYVPLKKFRLAGWSKDNDGMLDIKHIEEIRIGWGGYTGKEGEKITFITSAPEPVSLSFDRALWN